MGFLLQGMENVDIGGQQFIRVASWNEDGAGGYLEQVVRSTDNALYGADGSIIFQIAPIGTTWSNPEFHDGLGSGVSYHEIINIESVTVPYGTFSNAYVDRAYFDPDNPAFSNAPFWYEYVVPDVGWVKQVDYWASPNGPVTIELAQVSTVPIPSAFWMFGSGGLWMAALMKRRRRSSC